MIFVLNITVCSISEKISDFWSMSNSEGHFIKNGFQNNGKQRFRCSQCGQRKQENYVYNRYNCSRFVNFLSKLVKNGMGIRNIARVMEISINTVVRAIKRIARNIRKPSSFKHNQKCQVNEMRTFIKNKKEGIIWLFYALNKETKCELKKSQK